MTAARLAAIAIAAGAACGEAVDERLTDDYTSWKRVDVTGFAPGHTDSYRIVYINAIAATAPRDLATVYPLDSVVVKEIRDNDDGQPGALRYLAIMRKQTQPDAPLDDEAGWLFTSADEPGGSETYRRLCWARCHVAAPYVGAWYDYRD